MRYIITGHLGLIGTSLKKRLDSLGHKCVLAIDLREGNNIIDISRNDVEADIIFHLAAFCKINESIRKPHLPYLHNIAGTYAVLEYARKNNIPKIVFTSSTRVLYPNKNPYVASKMFCEEQIRAYSECYGLQYVIVRPSTVYCGFDDTTHRLIDLWMRAVLKNQSLKIYGDLNKTLDFTYVDDFVDGLLLCREQTNREFNIATGRSEKLIDVAEALVKMADSKSPIDFELPELAQPQEVEVDITEVTKLGYKAKIDIKEGLRKTLEFYKELNAR